MPATATEGRARSRAHFAVEEYITDGVRLAQVERFKADTVIAEDCSSELAARIVIRPEDRKNWYHVSR